MNRWRSIAGILVCLACLLSGCGSQSPAAAETSQPEDMAGSSQEEVLTDTAPTEPLSTPTEPPSVLTEGAESPLPTAKVPITPVADAKETRQLSPLPLPVEPGPAGEEGVVPGEVPEDLLKNILTDLQERKGIGRDEITLERAEAVVWRDGSLGCPEPDMMYPQVLTPGYSVVLRAGGDLYNYHASRGGYFFLCERSLPDKIMPPEEGIDPLSDE